MDGAGTGVGDEAAPAGKPEARGPSWMIDRGAGSPVVLVHGQPGEGADWEPVVAALEGRYRVLAPDRPGWGSNPRPAVGVAANADWLDGALEECVGDAAVLVVGHSFGGGIALALAARRPQRVRALVLVGSIGTDVALTRLDRLLAVPVMGGAIVRVGTVAARGVMSLARRSLKRMGRAAGIDRQADGNSMLRVLSGEEPVPADAWRSFTVEQRALVRETPDLEAALPSLEVPVVVVVGTHDRVVGVPASRALSSALAGAELLLVPGAGHVLPLEAPEYLAAVVDRYDLISRLRA
jgi:pimeloyl-ACP methyl ester carboxylesterase